MLRKGLYCLLFLMFSCGSSGKKEIPKNDTIKNTQVDTSLKRQTKLITRPLEELINEKESAWPMVLDWKKKAKNPVEILARDKKKADDALYRTQVTTKSTMGAIIYESGGILIDHGWLRILGSGNPKLDRDLPNWNFGKSYTKSFEEQPSFLLIADDVVGGFYAINNGGISEEGIGKVFYFAPELLEWENMEMGYTDFINFCFNGNLKTYYEEFRWKSWKSDLQKVDGTHGFYLFPGLYTKEGEDVEKVDKSVVPIQELWDFNFK